MNVGDVSELYDRINIKEIEEAICKYDWTEGLVKLVENDKVEVYKVLDEKSFVALLARFKEILDSVKLPVWKVVIPDIIDGKIAETGANYYIFNGVKNNGKRVVVFFRGTYGYKGTGPHQSAFVEKAIKEVLKLPIEVRSGDYLLSLLCIY